MIERTAKYAGWIVAIATAAFFLVDHNPFVLRAELQAIDSRLTLIQRTMLRMEQDKWQDRLEIAKLSPDQDLAAEMIEEAESELARIEAELTGETVSRP